MRCSSEEGGGWKYENSCYHVVNEMTSWQDAERHCRSMYNGHLVTVLDTLVDLFLGHILDDKKNELWIGIKMKVSFKYSLSFLFFFSPSFFLMFSIMEMFALREKVFDRRKNSSANFLNIFQ